METSKLIVRQPAKMAELNKLLETFENLNARVGERTSEDNSGDMGGGGGGATGGGGGAKLTSVIESRFGDPPLLKASFATTMMPASTTPVTMIAMR